MMSDIAGVVLVFHPDRSVLDNVTALLGEVARVYVVNNSPDHIPTTEILRELESKRNVSVLTQPGNVGVAAGFNAGMRAAIADGFPYVWIFDQDSSVSAGMAEQLVEPFHAWPRKVALTAPALRAAVTGYLYSGEPEYAAKEQATVISSGALFSREALKEFGLHDERLFIDYVDHDISLRARAAGWAVVQVYGAILDHRFGESISARVLGRRIYLANYSPMRHFHMARNRVVMIRRYGFGRWFWSDLRYVIRSWIKVLLCERDRSRKVGAALKGVIAGWRFPSVNERVE